MKFIPFADRGPIDTRAFLTQMVETSPAGQTVGQMRDRLKILKAIQTAPADGVVLEDAQQAILLGIINGRSDFVITSEQIIAIVDSVEQAGPPPTAKAAPREE